MSTPVSIRSPSASPSFFDNDRRSSASSVPLRPSSQSPNDGLYSIRAFSVGPIAGTSAPPNGRPIQSPELLEFSPLPSRSPDIRTASDPLVEKISSLESSLSLLEHANKQLVKKIDFLQKAMIVGGFIKEETILKPNLLKE